MRPRKLAADMARSPCPHTTVTGASLGSGAVGITPSSMLRAPGMWPAVYSLAWRTSITVGPSPSTPTTGIAARGRPLADHAPTLAIELADEMLVPDVEALANEVAAVLAGIEDEHQWPVRCDEPAEP